MVEESAVELVVAAAAVHTQQWHWSSDQHLSHIHLELVVPPQAGSPQEKTSEQLQHLSDQAAWKALLSLWQASVSSFAPAAGS